MGVGLRVRGRGRVKARVRAMVKARVDGAVGQQHLGIGLRGRVRG